MLKRIGKILRVDDDLLPLVAIVVVSFALACGFWVVRSHFEARAYNRLTGNNVTTFEAMWVALRVDCR